MGLQLVAGCPGIEEAGSEGREHSGENRVLGGLGILGTSSRYNSRLGIEV